MNVPCLGRLLPARVLALSTAGDPVLTLAKWKTNMFKSCSLKGSSDRMLSRTICFELETSQCGADPPLPAVLSRNLSVTRVFQGFICILSVMNVLLCPLS